MASYVTPRKNTAFVFYVALEDQANAGLFKTAPTLAAGDFKVSIDGGALANLTDLPTVTPSGGRMVKVALTASEMDGDNITVVASDASGAEWYDLVVNIQTSAQQVDDLATAAALATVDGIVDALALVAPDNKPTVAITGEASANVTLWKGDTPASLDVDGNVPTAGGGLTAQETADALLLAPSGAAADGSAMAQLSNIAANTAVCASVAANSTDATAAGAITRKRGNSWSIALTLGEVTGYTSLWFTIKSSYDDADSAALLHVKLNNPSASDGLLYVNGAAAADSTKGSITVSDASTGAIIVAVDETITDDLAPGTYYYDAQALIDGDVTTPDSGTFTITADVTRSVV